MSRQLLTRAIPSTGERLPVIGLGTWQTFDVGPSGAERAPLTEVLRDFADIGGRLVDSSPMYGRAEEVVGDLSHSLALRERLFVATKVWTTGRDAGIRQMEESMRRMRADPIDLIQVHNLLDAEVHLPVLREWKASGRVRYVGITHYKASGHDAVMRLMEREPLDFVQINYSVREREVERRLLPMARDLGIAVIVNRPFAEGALLRALRDRALPNWAATIGGESWAQLLLAFVISHEAVTVAIPATSSAAHLRANLRAASGELPDAELRERIASAAV